MLLLIRLPSPISKSGDSTIIQYRANVFVDSIKFPTPNYKKVEYINLNNESVTPNEIWGINVNKNQRNQKTQWLYEEVDAAKPLKYFIHLMNTKREVWSIALLAFVDYELIPINPDLKEDIIFCNVDFQKLVTIKAKIQLSSKDKHELPILAITNFFKILEPESEKLAQSTITIYNRRISLIGR